MLPLLVLIVDTGEGGGRGCRGRSASIISDSSKLQIKAVLGQVAEHFLFLFPVFLWNKGHQEDTICNDNLMYKHYTG